MLEQELIVADPTTEEGFCVAFLAGEHDVKLHLHPAKLAFFSD